MGEHNFSSDKFTVYGGWDNLNHGAEAKINISIYPNTDKIKEDIEKLLEIDNLEAVLEERKGKEEEVYKKIYESMQEWIDYAELTAICKKAIEFRKENAQVSASKKNVLNEWVADEDTYNDRHHIANNVYKMNYSIWETTERGYKRDERINIYYVTWDLWVSGVDTEHIAGQRNKRYTDKEKALKYIEGRKKAYGDLFEEMNPSIPKEYERLFKKNGILLSGYKVDNE